MEFGLKDYPRVASVRGLDIYSKYLQPKQGYRRDTYDTGEIVDLIHCKSHRDFDTAAASQMANKLTLVVDE